MYTNIFTHWSSIAIPNESYNTKTVVFNFIHCPMRKGDSRKHTMGSSKTWCTPRSKRIIIFPIQSVNHVNFGCLPSWTRSI